VSYLLILALTLTYYLLFSLLCFLVYFYDKQAAIQRRSRVPEKNLLLLSLIGGWPGALLAHCNFTPQVDEATVSALVFSDAGVALAVVVCIACRLRIFASAH
jgi:uncharacterized membrane protein YsdA (DUF1294 family)